MKDSQDSNSSGDRPPRSITGLLVIAVVAAVVLYLQWSPPRSGGANHPLVGQRLGQLLLQPLSENAVTVDGNSLLGRVTLINFWGTWCGPCQVELPHLIQIHRQFRDNPNFQFLSVTIPQGASTSREALIGMSSQRLEKLGAEFPFYGDEGTLDHIARISGEFALGIPTTLVLNEQGVIVGMWNGFTRGYERQMESIVRATLQAAPS